MIEDLKGSESWRMFRIISEFTEGLDKLSDIRFAVSFFGSARADRDTPNYRTAEVLAERLAAAGFAIVTGGGSGIMEAANKGALAGHGRSIGLHIRSDDQGDTNPYQNRTMEFRYFFARKVMFLRHSIGYVCFPGGFEVLDELFEALTLLGTHKIHPMPLVLIGKDFWNGLLGWIEEKMLAEGWIDRPELTRITLTDDPLQAVEVFNRHREWKLRKIRETAAACPTPREPPHPPAGESSDDEL